jgi:hypothetical protein
MVIPAGLQTPNGQGGSLGLGLVTGQGNDLGQAGNGLQLADAGAAGAQSLKQWGEEKWNLFLAWRQSNVDRWDAAMYGDARSVREIAQDWAMGFVGPTKMEFSGRIAEHAFEKHVLGIGARAEDPLFRGLGIRTVAQLEAHILDVIENPTAVRALSGGRIAYWQESSSTVVIQNPMHVDLGSVYQPTMGKAYFDSLR